MNLGSDALYKENAGTFDQLEKHKTGMDDSKRLGWPASSKVVGRREYQQAQPVMSYYYRTKKAL